jgi:hypothetical protein
MNRKLGLLLVFSFFAMQVFTTLHMAESGFGKHEHNGQVCDIYLHSQHVKYSSPSAAIVLQASESVTFTIAISELSIVSLPSYGVASPRAPPLFS